MCLPPRVSEHTTSIAEIPECHLDSDNGILKSTTGYYLTY